MRSVPPGQLTWKVLGHVASEVYDEGHLWISRLKSLYSSN